MRMDKWAGHVEDDEWRDSGQSSKGEIESEEGRWWIEEDGWINRDQVHKAGHLRDSGQTKKEEKWMDREIVDRPT